VADSNLAVGRIVDSISRSKHWASSAIFVIEDDSQNGVDHVDGHRHPTLVVSPYAKRGAVIFETGLPHRRHAEHAAGQPRHLVFLQQLHQDLPG